MEFWRELAQRAAERPGDWVEMEWRGRTVAARWWAAVWAWRINGRPAMLLRVKRLERARLPPPADGEPPRPRGRPRGAGDMRPRKRRAPRPRRLGLAEAWRTAARMADAGTLPAGVVWGAAGPADER